LHKLFGTDGVRGVANRELTGELAYKLGRAGGYFLTKDYIGANKPVLVIGKDTRLSGDMLEAALIAGLTSVGVDVIRLGVIPTPGVCYLTREREVEGGIMISASHNPIADNGIKFFNRDGIKLTDQEEIEIESLVFGKDKQLPLPTHADIGLVDEAYDWVNAYIDYLTKAVNLDLKGLKIVVDCANGAAYKVAPAVLKKLGVDVVVINDHPDGEKINVNCGSTAPDLLQKKVISTGADLGIAHDGDADRVILVDENGEIVEGDNIMAIAAIDMLKRSKLPNNTLVTTKYSNLGLREALNKFAGRVVITKNGDRYVLAEMLENGYLLGGEKSGHIIFKQYNTTGDGVLTAIKLLEIMQRENKKMSKLKSVMTYWPQILKNVRVSRKEEWQDNEAIKEVIKLASEEIGPTGRVFVRASGTEPLIRVMLEGKDEQLLNKWEDKIATLIKEELN